MHCARPRAYFEFQALPTLGEGNNMRKDLNIFDFLAQIPWWLCVTLSASFYLLLQYGIPYFENQGALVNEVHVSLGPVFAPVVALAFLAPVTFSLLKANRKRTFHDLKEEIKSIQELSWSQFKEQVSKAYAYAGYLILDNDPFTSDPSFELVMRKSANLYLLQSRYWRNRKIGLREVKKLYSLMHEKQASGIFLLTTGIFTREARRYAIGRPINLVDGLQLVELLDSIKENEPATNTSH
jgi:restriction system protein